MNRPGYVFPPLTPPVKRHGRPAAAKGQTTDSTAGLLLFNLNFGGEQENA